MEFIPRKYTIFSESKVDELLNEKPYYTFDDIIQSNKIAVILGEPASGKTYQFKQYENGNSTKVIDLIAVEDTESIDSDTKLVLIDSIDEAKVKYDDKTLKMKLKNFIQKSCFQINKDVKIVISCRYLEWKEIFDEVLKSLDAKLTVYYIKDLDKYDIENILKQQDIISDEFWTFVETNYLEELLKNIMMTIHIIENFESYKMQNIKYHDIYKKIIQDHLAPTTENENNKQLSSISMSKRLKIASSLAAYMTLEKKEYISVENMDILSGKLYKLEGIEITGEELKLILANTALFVGVSEVKFFHKSIQEFLTAYFINEKELDLETIKQLFSHDVRFYERYEEVIIHLTNMQPDYFRHLVAYDPFIFRRHPYLVEQEQKLLLVSMIHTLQDERQQAWGRWEYLHSSTLLQFEKVEDLCEIINSEIITKEVNYELFSYLVGILEHNYSQGLEDTIFGILEYLKSDKKTCIEYIWHHHISDATYNKRLFTFIVDNDMFNEDYNSFYMRIFEILYRKYSFDKLVILLKYFSDISDKDIILNLDISDLLLLTDYIEKFDSGQMSIVVFTLLKKYRNLSPLKEKSFEFIVSLIEKNHIGFNFHISDYEADLYRLEFDSFKEDFCKLFFKGDGNKPYLYSYSLILNHCDVKIRDIQSIIKIYPISQFPKHYQVFHRFEDIKELLMQNKQYSDLLKQEEKERQEHELFYEKERQKYKYYHEKKENEKIYKDAIDSFLETKDFRKVFFLSFERYDDSNKLNTKLKKDLGSLYPQFIEAIKDSFKNDRLYTKYQKYEIVGKYYRDSIMYSFLYVVISSNERKELICNKDEYEKIFWHLWALDRNSNGLKYKYFIEISKDYVPTLIAQYQNLIERSLPNEKYPSDGDISTLKYMLRKIGKFDFETLEDLVVQITELYALYYQRLTHYQKSNLLDFICLDKDNYGFIKSIMIVDKCKENIYLEHLFLIDLNKAVNDFYTSFFPEKIVYEVVTCKSFYPVYIYDTENDNCQINPIKLKAIKKLFGLLWTDGLKSTILSDDIFYNLLIRYYDYFKEGKRLSYNKRDDLVNAYWKYFAITPSRLSLLQRLSEYPNQRLQAKAKYSIEQIYNDNQELTMNYKEILDSFEPEDNSRFFDYKKLTSDLENISLMLTESRHSIFDKKEDLINDRFRDDLRLIGYTVGDQSRGGESESTKSVGERDIVIRNRDTSIAESILEGLIFKNKTEAIKHHKKLIHKYDTVGNKQNYLLVYVKEEDFIGKWEKYTSYFEDFEKEETEKENLKMGTTTHKNMTIIHIFINFYSNKELT